MITYELTIEELVDMVVGYLYEDGEIERKDDKGDGMFCYSVHSPETMTHAYVWTVPNNVISLTLDRYESLMKAAAPSGYTPLVIVGTPEGIYEFNMDTYKPEFELFTDGDKPDISVADLPIGKGKQILEFYPEFSSQEEYLDSLMSDAEPSAWDESETW